MYKPAVFFLWASIAGSLLGSSASYQLNNYNIEGQCRQFIDTELNPINNKLLQSTNHLNWIKEKQVDFMAQFHENNSELKSQMSNLKLKMDAHLDNVRTELEIHGCQKPITEAEFETRLMAFQAEMEEQLQKQISRQSKMVGKFLEVQAQLEEQQNLLENLVEKIITQQDIEKYCTKTITKEDLETSWLTLQSKTEISLRLVETGLQTLLTQIEGQTATVPAITQATPQPTLLKPLTGTNLEIPPNFELIGERYFYIESKSNKTWTAAAATCRRMGGYLASIKDEDELKAISAKLIDHRSYWLGINDMKKTGDYVSLASGGPAKVLKWRIGDPHRSIGLLNYIYLFDGKMIRGFSATTLLFICQADNKI